MWTRVNDSLMVISISQLDGVNEEKTRVDWELIAL